MKEEGRTAQMVEALVEKNLFFLRLCVCVSNYWLALNGTVWFGC